MNATSKFEISTQVVARTLGRETVVLDLESGTYFGLDEVGARIWQLMEAGHSLGEIRDLMADDYEATPDVLERDAMKLASDLVDKKLIRVI